MWSGVDKGSVGNKTFLDLNATFFFFFLPFTMFKCVLTCYCEMRVEGNYLPWSQ